MNRVLASGANFEREARGVLCTKTDLETPTNTEPGAIATGSLGRLKRNSCRFLEFHKPCVLHPVAIAPGSELIDAILTIQPTFCAKPLNGLSFLLLAPTLSRYAQGTLLRE